MSLSNIRKSLIVQELSRSAQFGKAIRKIEAAAADAVSRAFDEGSELGRSAASSYVTTIAGNLDNQKISDAEFRQFVRNTVAVMLEQGAIVLTAPVSDPAFEAFIPVKKVA